MTVLAFVVGFVVGLVVGVAIGWLMRRHLGCRSLTFFW